MKLYIENNGFNPYIGYGRFASYILHELINQGELAYPLQTQQIIYKNKYVERLQKINYEIPLLSILAPAYMKPSNINTRYLYSMTEADQLPDWWIDVIKSCNIQRIFTPSEYCTKSFSESTGIPTTTILAGTQPEDFPVIQQCDIPNRPYTFLCFADRGDRKGWVDVWTAFHKIFNQSQHDVKLIIKYRECDNENKGFMRSIISACKNTSYLQFIGEDIENIHDLYKLADCVVIPSHAEGWGMIPRESSMSGVPTITLKYSGLDDGFIEKWSQPITNYILVDAPQIEVNLKGKQAIPDADELANLMLHNYIWRDEVKDRFVNECAVWLRNNQTWGHTVSNIRNALYGTYSVLLKDLQDDIGIDDTQVVFTDAEIERFYVRANSNQDLAIYYAVRVLVMNSTKLMDYTVAMTTEKRSQVYAHLKEVMDMWEIISSEPESEVNIVGASLVPYRKKDKPWQNRARDKRRNTDEWDQWKG